jgi:RNA polymerase sigma factor (sigma-70 family)
MADGRLSGALRHLGGTALLRDGGALSDGQLLEGFLRDRNEAAFEALVRRHGPMVLGVCRRVLRNTHDADDAFQATFLALARKGAAIAARDRVGSWLYGVAYRTALYARRTASRRHAMEKQVEQMPEREVVEPESRAELRGLLDRELSRLPEVYRTPVVLCDLGGKPRQEVARQLGVPEGTVSSRLARGRELLRQRLLRQGLALTGAAWAPALAEASSVAVPAALLRATVQSGVLVAAGQSAAGAVSAPVAGLLRAVLRQMAVARFKAVAVVLLAVGLLGLAAGLVTHQVLGGKPADLASAAAPSPLPRKVAEGPGPVTVVRLGDVDSPRMPLSGELVNVNGTLFFPASGGVRPELWKCGLTPNGPEAERVKAFDAFPADFFPRFLTNANGTLFFVPGGVRGRELWKSDGTEAGTVLVKRFKVGGEMCGLIAVGKTLFFAGRDGMAGNALWKSDGTEAGTVLVKDRIDPFTTTTSPRSMADVNGTLFFAAIQHGVVVQFQLWKSDGTPEGTVRVRGTGAARAFERPSDLTVVNGTLFFLAMDPSHGFGLWKSDGTEAGTVKVKDIHPGPANLFPPPYLGNLTVVGRTLFFAADDGAHGRKLWKSDGTAAGTVMVKDVSPGREWQLKSSPNDAMAGVNGVLFFVADDGTLWKSDGTAAGTVPVKRIAPNLDDHSRNRLTNVNGYLYCQVENGHNDFKLWRSDGTEAGTVLVMERKFDKVTRMPGPHITDVTTVCEAMFFTAYRPLGAVWGPELMHVPAPRRPRD